MVGELFFQSRFASVNSCEILFFMQRTLRILALTLAATACLAWLGLGANRGWTRTSVPVKKIDEVTGIEGVEYRKRFVPGLELLGGTLAGAAMLAGVSLFLGHPQTKQNKRNEMK